MSARMRGENVGWRTIYHSYRPVEEYLDLLEVVGCHSSRGVVRPIDALALHLLLDMSLPRPIVLDLAGDASNGVSTLLCRSQSQVREVITVSSPPQGVTPAWRSILENYLATSNPPALAPWTELDGDADLARAVKERCGAASPLVLRPATAQTPEDLGRKIAHWLGLRSDLVVVLLALGETGQCEHLASLVSTFGSHSPYRLTLLREQAASFHECQLGLVYHRNHPSLGGILVRLRQLFTGNFTFLNLIKNTCEAAIQAGQREQAIQHPIGPLAEARHLIAEKDRALADKDRTLTIVRQELTQATAGLSYKLARRMARARALLAPEGSTRYRALKKMVRVVSDWKAVSRSSGA